MKLAVCGTGIFARDSHLPAFKQVGDIDVTACYNRTKPKAEQFAAAAGSAKVYETLEELLSSNSIDAVDVLVPVDQNLKIVKLALAHGKPLAFEKPISHSLEEGREIVKLAAEAKVPVMILENWVYHNSTRKLKELLPQIGSVVSFNYQHTAPFKRNKFHETMWRQDPKHIGGYLSDGGVHEIALLTEVLGNIKSVSAHTAQIQEISGASDVLNASVKLDSGAFGSYTYSTSLGACEPQLVFQIFGTIGSLVLHDNCNDQATVTLRSGNGASNIQETVIELHPNEIDGVVEEFKNFKAAVDAKNPSLVAATPAKGFHHYAAVVAMIQSAERDGELTKVETL